MAKTKISEYDSSSSANTDIDSIDLGEGTMVPSDVNNALREVMAHLADMNGGTQAIQDTFTLSDPADDTKRVRLDAVGITAGNTRVLTAPDADVTIAGLEAAQEFTKTQNFNATTLTDAASIGWDASVNQVTSVTLTDNRTLAAPTNMVDGGVYTLMAIQDGTGSRTLSYNAVFKFSAATAPTLTTTAAAKDILVFYSDGTNMYEIGRSLNVS
jgi:hypothetical protein|tara:strand:- start:1786 stop:2424 length:639 start_codon:yes stop_codon:yes gene_type:complete